MISTNDYSQLRQIAGDLEEPIGILCYGRSGTVLLHSLMDGHPSLIVTAGVYLYCLYDFYRRNAQLSTCELVNLFVSEFSFLFDAGELQGDVLGLRRMGSERNQVLSLDKESFIKCMFEILDPKEQTVPRKLFIQAIHLAYHYALKRPLSQPLKIVFPLHLLGRSADEFAMDFPRAKFIYMVRQPVSSIESFFAYYRNMEQLFGTAASSLLEHFLSAGRPCPGRAHQTLAVRLEDLHRNPEVVLHNLCRWLEIPWHESLLKSTFHGLQWWNGVGSVQVSGFSESIVLRKRDTKVIPDFDMIRLQILLASKHEAWHYELPKWQGSVLARMLVLPFLLIPLRMEILAAFSGRLPRRTPSFLTRTPLVPAARLLVLGREWFVCRKLLLIACLKSLSTEPQEASLLG